MDKRFKQVNTKLDRIMDRVDIKLDSGLREGRTLTVKRFPVDLFDLHKIPLSMRFDQIDDKIVE